MEWLLRRNYWLVKLTGALIVAAFAAHTATTLLAMWLFSGTLATEAPTVDDEATDDEAAADDAPAVVAAADNPWKRDPEKIGARILGTNVFCPTCTPESEGGEGPAVRRPDGTIDPGGLRYSDLPLEVAATMEAEDPAYSLATVHITDRGFSGLYGVGDALMPGVTIVAIAGGRVDLLNGTTPEYVRVGRRPPEAAKAPARPSTTTTSKPLPKAPSNQIPGADEAIKCDGDGCQVERRFVEGLIASPAQLVGQGRAAPAKTGAGEDGFRIGGVRSGTLPDLLGLENGDIITEVGGKPLTMDSMLSLSAQLKSARHIEVTIDRRGTKVVKALELV